MQSTSHPAISSGDERRSHTLNSTESHSQNSLDFLTLQRTMDLHNFTNTRGITTDLIADPVQTMRSSISRSEITSDSLPSFSQNYSKRDLNLNKRLNRKRVLV